MSARPSMVCNGCGRSPGQILAYVQDVRTMNLASADEYVWQEEGTLNRENGHFLCDGCYIAAGMPSSPRGWKAP